MSLEDIFITIVDQSAPKNRYERRTQKSRNQRTSIETEVAKNIVAKSEKKGADLSDLFDGDK